MARPQGLHECPSGTQVRTRVRGHRWSHRAWPSSSPRWHGAASARGVTLLLSGKTPHPAECEHTCVRSPPRSRVGAPPARLAPPGLGAAGSWAPPPVPTGGAPLRAARGSPERPSRLSVRPSTHSLLALPLSLSPEGGKGRAPRGGAAAVSLSLAACRLLHQACFERVCIKWMQAAIP